MSAFTLAHVVTFAEDPFFTELWVAVFHSSISIWTTPLIISFRVGLEVTKLSQLCILWEGLNFAFILKERFSEYRFMWQFSPRPLGISPFSSEYTGLFLMSVVP